GARGKRTQGDTAGPPDRSLIPRLRECRLRDLTRGAGLAYADGCEVAEGERMNEAEWLICADPSAMLRFVKGRVSERKLLLFTAPCGRRLWRLLEDKRSRDAVMVGERYADKEATADEFAVARRRAIEAGGALASTIARAVSEGWDTLTRTGK